MGETGSDTPLTAARRMLDVFASVGAERFHVTWTNRAGSPRRPRSHAKTCNRLAVEPAAADMAEELGALPPARFNAAD